MREMKGCVVTYLHIMPLTYIHFSSEKSSVIGAGFVVVSTIRGPRIGHARAIESKHAAPMIGTDSKPGRRSIIGSE